MAEYWRIRLKSPDRDCTFDAWERNEVGIWYGAWSAEDFRNADDQRRTNKQIADILNDLPAQRNLVESGAWDTPITPDSVNTALRFFNRISDGDWVVIYLEAGQRIALAQMSGAVCSENHHPLNTRAGEIFKYRKIRDKKTFARAELPDAYRLLPQQGRSNVHKFSEMREHVKMLVEHATPDELVDELGKMSFDRQLDLMGASSWESFCVSWLIMERNFVPTGLSTGRTMKAVDIVGRDRQSGKRIVAQCKKNPRPIPIAEEFVTSLASDDEGYFFAYGGCTEKSSTTGIRVIDGLHAREWSETENGRLFQRLFLGS
jgi:hypothetical protein